MATQRKRKSPTKRGASPLRVNEPGIRNEYRRPKSSGNLTSILVICLVCAVIVLCFFGYLYSNKTKAPLPVQKVVEQKPIAPVVAPKEPPVVVEEKVEVVPKKKKNPEEKKKAKIEVSEKEKKVENTDPVNAEGEKSTKVPTKDEDAVEMPKTFMGGLKNPEEEEKNKTKNQNQNQDQDRTREERRKKKELDME